MLANAGKTCNRCSASSPPVRRSAAPNGVEEHKARPRSLPPGIRPRGKGYVYDWRDATGKTFCRKAGDTIDEAIAFKAKIDAELAAGTFVASSKTTFAEYAAHWIETHQLKSQTRRGYRSTLNAHLVPFFGSYRLVKITPALVREWYTQQLTLGLANNTVREHVAVLKSILKTAQADGHLPYLPTTGLRVPRQTKRRPKVLTFKHAWAPVMAAPEEWRALFATAIFTGLRLGELLALSRDEVDLDARVIHVRATLSEVARRKPRLMIEEPKSEGGVRDVPIVERSPNCSSRTSTGCPPTSSTCSRRPPGSSSTAPRSTKCGARSARHSGCPTYASTT